MFENYMEGRAFLLAAGKKASEVDDQLFRASISRYERWAASLSDRIQRWWEVPSEYARAFDVSRLPNPFAVSTVMRWLQWKRGWFLSWGPRTEQPQKCGLLVFGTTGLGKTRTVYERLRQVLMFGEFSFEAIGAKELSEKIFGLVWSEPNDLTEYVSELIETDILFIDDLGQAKLTPRFAEELGGIVERRTSRGKPIVVTCQTLGEPLIYSLCGNDDNLRVKAKAIVRRLRDYCMQVDFNYRPPEESASTCARARPPG
jgi:hypothetical protein